ncbi:mRNA transport regulator Mtr10p [[Candida] anglica]|uniref:mRNA transport regulator Mtr10p n=1 Tax=[Candida] anglica TaxID=148631 RepID=A0ABP0EIX2_9ASCO
MSSPLTQVKTALATMYSNGTQEEKKTATQLLESFQKSQEAWELVHTILNDSNESIEFRLFAAQTLRSKVTYDLAQLPEGSYPQLKDSLIDLLTKYPDQPHRIIRTQLCIALSQFALQYLTWENALTEIISKLSKEELITSLLDFLKILPEELSDVKKTSLTDDEFNSRTQALITSNVEQVLMILNNLTTSNQGNSKLNSLILDCLNSWIKECPIESILQITTLTNLIFQSLNNEDTFEKSIECLCTIMSETRDIDNHELIDALFQQLLQLHSYMSSNKELLEDPETFGSLTRLYVEAGEAWHVLIAKNPKHFKPLVEILLECCQRNEDLDVVKFTFMFWYLLKQLLTLPKFTDAKQEFSEIYGKLIEIIIRHLTYPTDSNDDDNLFDGDKEQEDKFKEFRYEMGDVLKDCCAVVGPTRALNIPFQQIQTILQSGNNSARWQNLEAPLFSMRAMAKEVPLKEKTILPTIMTFLVQLPEHPKIRYAATLVLGRYTEWTAKNPSFLEPQLNYIIKGFEGADLSKNKDIIVAASHALMYFCQDCSELLVNYLEPLYLLYGQVKDQLDIESTYELTDGLAHVIKQLPEENLYKTLGMFCKPTLDLLNSILNSNEQGDQVYKLLADQLEVLTTFITVLRCKDFEKPISPVCNFFIDSIWPVVSQIISKFGNVLIVSERSLKLIKNSVQSFSTYLNPILPAIATILHDGFAKTKFGCYLWVSGILIREYGDEYSSEDIKESIYQFALSQCSLFYDILKAEQNLKNIPDVIEDFFRMMNDLLMFYPFKMISNFDLLKPTWDSSIVSLNSLDQVNPLVAVLHFLIDLISWGLPTPPISFFDENPQHVREGVQQFLILDNNGGHLMKVVIEGLIYHFHNDIQQDASDLLLKILTVIPDSNVSINWLTDVVKSLPNVSGKELDKLINTVSVSLPNKDNRRIRTSIRDFVHWYSRKNVSPRSEF